jgi:membrane associated rhomboid family serine protease
VFRLPPLTPFVKKLLITLAGLFVLTALLQNFAGVPVVPLLALDPDVLSPATLWQIFTNVLVQSPTQLFPLIINLLFIWLILPPFEDRYGKTRVIQLSLIATVCSSLSTILVGQLLPGYAMRIEGPGPITLAAISAYAVLLPPHAEVSFFGVLPMQSKHLLWVVVGLSVLGFITTLNLTSLASDLGAIGGGIGFVKWWMHRRPPRKASQRKSSSRFRVVGRDDEPPRGGWMN